MNWGQLQKGCHRLLDECFDRKEGYKWLKTSFGVEHFSQLDPKKDKEKLREIYDELFKLSVLFSEQAQ
jgi:hypothetical protein